MKLARILERFESALTDLGLIPITTVFQPLLNQRGQVGESGDDPTNPGADALEHEPPEDTDGGDDKPPAPSDGEPPPDAGDDATPAPADKTPDTTPADDQSVDQLTQEMERMKVELEQAKNMAAFYSQFYQQQQVPAQQQPGQTPGQQQASGQLPDGVVNPGDWEEQEQTANWVTHTVKNELQQGYQSVILPMMQQLSTAVQGLQMALAKSGKEDFDSVQREAINEIFTMAPDGNVIGVKNPALLNYFRSQSNPFEAMYQYGLTKLAPDKIKQQVSKHSRKAIEALGKKPKGPTHPKGGGKGEEPGAELDWDTPPDRAEKILGKRGLI